jgi:hypothetical protein
VKCKDRVVEESTWIFEDEYQKTRKGKAKVDEGPSVGIALGYAIF